MRKGDGVEQRQAPGARVTGGGGWWRLVAADGGGWRTMHISPWRNPISPKKGKQSCLAGLHAESKARRRWASEGFTTSTRPVQRTWKAVGHSFSEMIDSLPRGRGGGCRGEVKGGQRRSREVRGDQAPADAVWGQLRADERASRGASMPQQAVRLGSGSGSGSGSRVELPRFGVDSGLGSVGAYPSL